MNFCKKVLTVFSLLLISFSLLGGKAAFGYEQGSIESLIDSYVSLEFDSIMQHNVLDNSNIIRNSNYKKYNELFIKNRVEWFSKLEKDLLDYTAYTDIKDVVEHDNVYAVKVLIGHDLTFSDSSDIVQMLRDEEHIILIEKYENSFYILDDLIISDANNLGYDVDLNDLSTIYDAGNALLKEKMNVIEECSENINLKALQYKEFERKTLKNLMFSNVKSTRSSYNRTKAVNYAAANWDAPEVDKGQDCTNFISACINAGGLSQTDLWKPRSNAWKSVGMFYDYFVIKSGRGAEYSWSSELGDIVQFGKGAYDWRHSTIITYVRPTTGELFLSAHSNPRYNYAYSNFFGSYSTSRFIHIY